MSQLNGMNEIAVYARRSIPTLLQWIKEAGFPARKIGGIWLSDKGEVDKWRLSYLENRPVSKKKG